MARVNKQNNAVLIDAAIAKIEDALAAGLGWLNTVYGRAERIVKVIDGKRYYMPAWYVGNEVSGDNEYTLLVPDSRLGNYAFFTVDDPEEITLRRGEQSSFRLPFSLIVWCDIRTVTEDRNREQVKRDILRVLNNVFFPFTARMTVAQIYEKSENVFKGFTLDEAQNQYMMHPYAAWRITGELFVEDECYEQAPATVFFPVYYDDAFYTVKAGELFEVVFKRETHTAYTVTANGEEVQPNAEGRYFVEITEPTYIFVESVSDYKNVYYNGQTFHVLAGTAFHVEFVQEENVEYEVTANAEDITPVDNEYYATITGDTLIQVVSFDLNPIVNALAAI